MITLYKLLRHSGFSERYYFNGPVAVDDVQFVHAGIQISDIYINLPGEKLLNFALIHFSFEFFL